MKNQYKEGVKLIMESSLDLKNIKYFDGRNGTGCSATIYFNGKKCGTFLDEAHGGEYYIDYTCPELNDFLKSLPKFSEVEWMKAINHKVEDFHTNERDNTWKWYWCDAILQEKEITKQYNKWLKKVVIFNKDKKKIEHYRCLYKLLEQPKYRAAINEIAGNNIILNDLPKNKAYDYFNKYAK